MTAIKKFRTVDGDFAVDYTALENKPTIPSKTSDLTNDSGFLTQAVLSGYATEDYVDNHHDATKQNVISDLATIRSGAALGATALQEHQSLAAYRTSAAQDVIDASKQDVITDIDDIREGAALGETALQEVPSTYRTAAAQDVIDAGKATSSEMEQVESDVSTIKAKIPTQATSSNQLADKSFVNSSISTNTANYISDDGEPFTSVSDLPTSGVTNNDYAFVTGTDTAGNTYFDRYKATVSGSNVSWAKEYRLNNSSFTAAQWAAIQSGVTSSKVSGYDSHVANGAIHVTSAQKSAWDAKQDKIPANTYDAYGAASTVQTNLNQHTGNSDIHVTAAKKTEWSGKYSKPSSGIPKTDLASAVQTSLSRADSALQEVLPVLNASGVLVF